MLNLTPIADADAPNALRAGTYRTFLSTDGLVLKGKGFTGDVITLGGTGSPPGPTLSALTLMGNSVEEGTALGELVGVLAGRTTGSTLSLTDTAGSRFALSGLNIVAGAVATDFAMATSHSITVREVLAGATNTPRDTVLTINVTEAAAGIEPLTQVQAARFLNSATIGATEPEMAALTGADQTEMDAWFAQQAALTPSVSGAAVLADGFGEPFLKRAVTAPDQLRMRMTLALSEILVVSSIGVFFGIAGPIAAYGDVLTNGALGRYRTLLGHVSRHSAMGQYLTFFKNDKADLMTGRRPDENYAREVMQLFTVGLNKLNPDGTRMLSGGLPIPTYGQSEIVNTAAVFTGLGPNADGQPFGTEAEQESAWEFGPNPEFLNMRAMARYPTHHQVGEKTIIDGIVIPTGGTVDSDVDAVLDALCEHPSCAPFICKQLIQRLVTSNPTPGYVQRVVNRWLATYDDADHLMQVAKAILLDDEALNPPTGSTSALGRAQSALYQILRLLRAFGADSDSGVWDDNPLNATLTQQNLTFLGASSVFNFYRPGFEIPTVPGLLVPELQIVTEASVAQTAETMIQQLFRFRDQAGDRYVTQFFSPVASGTDDDGVYMSYGPWEARAATPTVLVDDLALLLTGGRMPAEDRALIAAAVDDIGDVGAAAPVSAQKIFAAALLFSVAPTAIVS
ncbi:DUF1800 family protein [Nevskia sp.]|uniref:DUF1800 family protein n=1 Tax=Nevskia sp. TaxID=1929292 RepID=UPI0025F02B31|nr:DUF1800 family protein [Nevskia sp.]